MRHISLSQLLRRHLRRHSSIRKAVVFLLDEQIMTSSADTPRGEALVGAQSALAGLEGDSVGLRL